MGDVWIPSSPSRKVIIPRRGNVMRVSKLIDTVTRTWDEEKLRSLFFLVDVGGIIKIPLAVGMMGDFVSWNYTFIQGLAYSLFVQPILQNGIVSLINTPKLLILTFVLTEKNYIPGNNLKNITIYPTKIPPAVLA
jgi:hypothetical protein